jgi:hypothetical protein
MYSLSGLLQREYLTIKMVKTVTNSSKLVKQLVNIHKASDPPCGNDETGLLVFLAEGIVAYFQVRLVSQKRLNGSKGV